MSNTPTPADTTAITVAEQAYEIVRIARIAQGAQDLPTWADVSAQKKIALTDAARAALDGRDVWDVWCLSCGEQPNDATQVLWRQRPPLLQLLPRAYTAFGRAVASLLPEVSTPVTDILNDEIPNLTEDEPSIEEVVEEVVEEVGLGDEKVSGTPAKGNKKSRK